MVGVRKLRGGETQKAMRTLKRKAAKSNVNSKEHREALRGIAKLAKKMARKVAAEKKAPAAKKKE